MNVVTGQSQQFQFYFDSTNKSCLSPEQLIPLLVETKTLTTRVYLILKSVYFPLTAVNCANTYKQCALTDNVNV